VQPADHDAFETLNRACRDADGPLAVQPPPFEALATDSRFATLGAFADPDMLSMGWAKRAGDSLTMYVSVHPEHRASGLGGTLIDRLEDVALRLAERALFVIRDEALTPEAEVLYAGRGYACDFIEYWLRRDLRTALPDVPSLDNYETWTLDSIPRFVDTYVEGFRDRWAGRPSDEATWAAEHSEDEDFRPEMTLLALVDGKPAGLVTTFIETDSAEGYVGQIAVRPEYRRRGIAAGLLATVMHKLREVGATRVDLHVNENNVPATQLYTRLGFARVGRRGKFSRSALVADTAEPPARQ
jgi:GNAT superfamily N-acetyltransferase